MLVLGNNIVNIKDFIDVDNPNDLNREEKDDLLFALLEQLNLRVCRSVFDPELTVLITKE